MRMVLALSLIALAACSGAPQGDFDPNEAAASRHFSLAGSDLNRPAESDGDSCPTAFPTGGPVESGEDGVESFFCEY